MILSAIIIFALLAACGSSDPGSSGPNDGEAMNGGTSSGAEITSTWSAGNTTDSDTATNNITEPEKTDGAINQGGANEQLLQSASVDLDADGESEQVEAVQISSDTTEANSAGELEGQLIIRNSKSENKITFWKNNTGQSGLLTSMQFEDLDGDGAKDVFIIIPGNGASFSYSNYFIYSYKKNISYSFVSDNDLVDFINNFSFKYRVDNKLSIINSRQKFSADLTIELDNDQQSMDEYMMDYEKSSWIEPVSIDIGESSKLTLTTGVKGIPEIKVPLPVFGLATVDMIGELDLFYTVDSSFKPVLNRFEVIDFKDADKTKVGSCNVK